MLPNTQMISLNAINLLVIVLEMQCFLEGRKFPISQTVSRRLSTRTSNFDSGPISVRFVEGEVVFSEYFRFPLRMGRAADHSPPSSAAVEEE